MPMPRQPAPPAVANAQQGPLLTVREFLLSGNTLLDTGTLQAALRGFLDRPLDYEQLKQAAAVVAERYRSAGWVVRAYLPEQEVAEGVVRIHIVEAVLGALQFEGPLPRRVGREQVAHVILAQQAPGQPLHADTLDRALLLADELPGIHVAGSLREGTAAGQTDLLLLLQDEPLVTGTLQVDNAGNRSTGSARLGLDLGVNSAFHRGDQLGASLLHTEGSDYLRLEATVPAGNDGWRVGASVSTLRYRLVLADFAALDAHGSSDAAGLHASYPILRSRLARLSFNAQATHKGFDNQAQAGTRSRYGSDSLSLGLGGTRLDGLGGGGSNSASLSLTAGRLDLGGSPSQPADAAGARTEGIFHVLRYSLGRQQLLGANLTLQATLSGQWSEANLDSSEKFYLGGAQGVRAYPAGEAGGAQGQLLSLELRWRLPRGLELTFFHDQGQVRVNTRSDFAGASVPNAYGLRGSGLALDWQAASGLLLRVACARRDGDHPSPGTGGADQDGSHVMDRCWLGASMPF